MFLLSYFGSCSQAVESLALLACENVDHMDSEPMPSADGDIPDLLTPISHSGVSVQAILILFVPLIFKGFW